MHAKDPNLSYPSVPVYPTLLMVEEEEAVRQFLAIALRMHGLCVWPCGSGREAISVYQQFSPAFPMVLVDVGMTGMDGVQTLAGLRAVNPKVDCSLMTGGAENYTASQLLEQGPTRILAKPFRLDAIVSDFHRVVQTNPNWAGRDEQRAPSGALPAPVAAG